MPLREFLRSPRCCRIAFSCNRYKCFLNHIIGKLPLTPPQLAHLVLKQLQHVVILQELIYDGFPRGFVAMLDGTFDHVAAAFLLGELDDVPQHEPAEALTLLRGRHVDDTLDDVVAVVVLDEVDGLALQRLDESAAVLRPHDIGTFDDYRAAVFLSGNLGVRRDGEAHSRTVGDDVFVE